MRKSLADIADMLRDVPYPGIIPPELEHLHCYLTDAGHCLLAVPEVLLDKAAPEDIVLSEVPLPVRFVLESAWKVIPGTDSISVPVEYDDDLGALVPDEYPDEF